MTAAEHSAAAAALTVLRNGLWAAQHVGGGSTYASHVAEVAVAIGRLKAYVASQAPPPNDHDRKVDGGAKS